MRRDDAHHRPHHRAASGHEDPPAPCRQARRSAWSAAGQHRCRLTSGRCSTLSPDAAQAEPCPAGLPGTASPLDALPSLPPEAPSPTPPVSQAMPIALDTTLSQPILGFMWKGASYSFESPPTSRRSLRGSPPPGAPWRPPRATAASLWPAGSRGRPCCSGSATRGGASLPSSPRAAATGSRSPLESVESLNVAVTAGIVFHYLAGVVRQPILGSGSGEEDE